MKIVYESGFAYAPPNTPRMLAYERSRKSQNLGQVFHIEDNRRVTVLNGVALKKAHYSSVKKDVDTEKDSLLKQICGD